MYSEMDDNDGPKKSMPINDLMQIRRNRINDIKNSFDAVKAAALHAITDNVGNSSSSRDLGSLNADKATNQSQDIGTKYDPQHLMFKRMVYSKELTKNRLSNWDENSQITFDKTNIEAKEDEAFFENLKKRIGNDIKNKLYNKIEVPLPKRSSIPRKRKSAFTNESLDLMKKCRTQNLGKIDNSSSHNDNGIFSLENKSDNENQENIVADEMLGQSESFFLHKKITPHISITMNQHFSDNSSSNRIKDDDDDLRCLTPPGINGINYIPEI